MKSFLWGRIFIGAIIYAAILILLHQIHVMLRSYKTLMNPDEMLASKLDLVLIWIIWPLCAFIFPLFFKKAFGHSITKFQLICFIELGLFLFAAYHTLIGYHWYPGEWEYHLQNVGFSSMPRWMAITWLFIKDISEVMIVLSICLFVMFILYLAVKKIWFFLLIKKSGLKH